MDARDARRVRWAVVAIGPAIWVVALPVPGWNPERLVLSAWLVGWASCGLQMPLDSQIKDRDPDDPLFASPKRPRPQSEPGGQHQAVTRAD